VLLSVLVLAVGWSLFPSGSEKVKRIKRVLLLSVLLVLMPFILSCMFVVFGAHGAAFEHGIGPHNYFQ
jgi:hypothetical protein